MKMPCKYSNSKTYYLNDDHHPLALVQFYVIRALNQNVLALCVLAPTPARGILNTSYEQWARFLWMRVLLHNNKIIIMLLECIN